ncbi:unnamed protein product [Candidula unifasciata]|uniref:Uncharacterized protein n=1 Tax=Candidula unifasciata TaxID=100452 RepID=A0A8S3YQP1_9EUPU|nr:unnamed protein product [Candidula unifasciata]
MTTENNDNLKTILTKNGDVPYNKEDGNYDSNNLLEIKQQALADTTPDENNKIQEKTHRQSRTVSFSEDTCDFKNSNAVKRNSIAKHSEEIKSATNVEYDDSNVPYDRGWAWVIDFSCFLLFFVYLSHDHWHSVLLLDYMQEFNIPITVVTIMMSVGSICYCVATQISTNVLVIRFSIRVVTSVAAIFNVAATLLLAGVPNITVFFIINLIKYIVKGVTLIATLTLVGYYFRQRRGLAATLGLLGVGTSAMCAPPLIRYLRDEYGFQGCFLIMAGLEMHAIVATLLLRPISTYRRRKIVPKDVRPEKARSHPLTPNNRADRTVFEKHSVYDSDESNKLITSNLAASPSENISVSEHQEQLASSPARITEISITEIDELGSNLEEEEEVSLPLIQADHESNNITRDLSRSSETGEINGKLYLSADKGKDRGNVEMGSDTNTHEVLYAADGYPKDVSSTNVPNDELKQTAFTNNITITSMSCSTKETVPHFTEVTDEHKEKGNISSDDELSHISRLIRPEISSKDIQIEMAAPKVRRASNWSLYTASTMGSLLNIAHVTALEPDKPKSRFWVKDLIDISLLRNYLAMMIAFSYILIHMSGFSTVYLPSHAKRMDISSQKAAILLTIVGSMDIVGRLAFGFLADLKIVRPHLIIAGISAALGTVTHFMPLFTTFETLVLFSVAQGLFGGVGMNLTTVLIVDVLGIQHLGKMLSMSSMFNSISMFIQHPIQGAVIETTGGFMATYHYIGTCLLLDTCLLLAEPLLHKLQTAKEKTRNVKGNITSAA